MNPSPSNSHPVTSYLVPATLVLAAAESQASASTNPKTHPSANQQPPYPLSPATLGCTHRFLRLLKTHVHASTIPRP